jgi:hypothetical protein
LATRQQPSEGVPPPAAVDPADVEELMSWGFEREAVLAALEAAGRSKELAANMLLG